MKQKDIDKRLGKKVKLNGQALSEVLTVEENAVVAFWTFWENRAEDRKVKHLQEHDALSKQDAAKIEKDAEAEGQAVLDNFGGDARKALDSLM